MSLLLLLLGEEEAAPPVGDTIEVTIAGAPVTIQQGWSILSTSNGRDTLRCDVLSADGSYRPEMDDEIIMTLSGTRIFGGTIQTPTEHGVGGWPLEPIITGVSAMDFNGLVDRRYITATIPPGTVKAALLVVEPYLTTYGVTLDPAQADGPSLPELVYNRRKAADVFTELATLSGYVWEIDYNKVMRMYAPGTVAAPFNLTMGDGQTFGDITTETSRSAAGQVYANRVIVMAGTPEVPIIGQADDAAEQALRGLWEIVIVAETVFDQDMADALADAYLLQRTPSPKTVRYRTLTHGLKPGQTQTIDLSWRNINNVFMLSEVNIRGEMNRLFYSVTALEGSVFQPGWRNLYKQWLSPLTQVTVSPGGSPGRSVYFLGGSGETWVEDAGPTWIPASAVEVILDTIALGTTAYKVVVRLRAAAGSVTARLRNITDGITVGTSAAVSVAAWQTPAPFAVTLTNGSKIYRLELLPSQANTRVAAVGYLEKA